MDTTTAPPEEPRTSAPPAEPQGFDVAADVAALKSAAKQDYSDQWKEPEATKPPEAKAPEGDPAAPASPGTDTPPEGAKSTEAAREFIECYDIVQCQGFHIYSDGMPAEKFALDKFPKERAIHHLAKGLEKMGSPEVPWWLGMVLALTPPAFVNYMTAKEHRAAAATAATNKAKAARGEHIAPTNITRPARTAQPADAVAPAMKVVHTSAPPKVNTSLPLCAECGINHVKSKRKKYCSQSCAGKATSRSNKDKAATPPAPAQ